MVKTLYKIITEEMERRGMDLGLVELSSGFGGSGDIDHLNLEAEFKKYLESPTGNFMGYRFEDCVCVYSDIDFTPYIMTMDRKVSKSSTEVPTTIYIGDYRGEVITIYEKVREYYSPISEHYREYFSGIAEFRISIYDIDFEFGECKSGHLTGVRHPNRFDYSTEQIELIKDLSDRVERAKKHNRSGKVWNINPEKIVKTMFDIWAGPKITKNS